MQKNLEEVAKIDFQHIQRIIKETTILEANSSFTVHPDYQLALFSNFITQYKDLGVSICYDYCVLPSSRIYTCTNIITAIILNREVPWTIKAMHFYNVVLNASWGKIQEAAIDALKKIGAYTELDMLKSKIKDDKLSRQLVYEKDSISFIGLIKKYFGSYLDK
jgi:hypothetical protein